MIPKTFINDLLAKTDIVPVIDNRVPLKKKGREYVACCPFHGEKTPSFTVSPQKQFFHCFGCGIHGSAISFLMEFENLNFVEAIETLAQEQGIEVPREQQPGFSPPKQTLEPLYDVMEKASLFFQRQLKATPKAIDYLKNRGLSGEIAKTFTLGYAPAGWHHLKNHLQANFSASTLLEAGLLSRKNQGETYDKFRDRIIFPIRDHRGRPIAFGGRILDAGEPKYLNSPESEIFHKSQTLYGLFEARQIRQKLAEIIVVEGYMDVVALAQHGIHHAVATLGTATTANHIQQLMRLVPRIVFCFDGDRAGREAAWRALTQAMGVLLDGKELAFLFLPEGEDPDSYIRQQGKQAFLELTQSATPLSSYLLDTLKQRHNITTHEGRSALMNEATPLIVPLPASTLKAQLDDSLLKITNINPRRPQTAKSEPFPTQSRKRTLSVTPMRVAIAALLHQPALLEQLDLQSPAELKAQSGGELLNAIFDIIRANPETNTAMLAEYFRDSIHESHVNQLSVWQPPGVEVEDGWVRLLQDSLAVMYRQTRETQLSDLLQKTQSRPLSELSAEEKRQLRSLLDK